MFRRVQALFIAACSGLAPSTATAPPPQQPVATVPCAIAADADEIGFTDGNRWTYSVFRAWHSALKEPPIAVDVRVERVERVGRFRVAWLDAKHVETSDHVVVPTARVLDDGVVHLVLGERPAATEAAIAEALRGAPSESGDSRLVSRDCASAFCGMASGALSASGEGDGEGWSHEISFMAVPGLGLTSFVDAEYSAETGDGGARYVLLAGWDLAAAPKRAAVGAEPAEVSKLRAILHAAAKQGDVAKVLPHVDEDIQISSITAITGKQTAAEAWAVDDGTAMRALALATSKPCGQVEERTVVCPATAAEVTCKSKPTGPRAVLFRGTAWFLVELHAGGADDIYTKLESDDGPVRPQRMIRR